ncbi:MAG: hypothetical protein EOO00_01530 [Chitinophagaceae bacterium]|nr:MAG: hypothetical protein EOO00_01530 [Chitinophagaceae bacterium]
MATAVKKFSDPETYMLMGDAYRILIDGGNAVTSYQKALELDPKHAAAKNAIAKVYLTQNNPDYFLPAFEDAIKLDPTYSPAMFELYYYWYFRDVNKAAGFLDQYVANSDPGVEQELMKADFLYASSKFAEAKAKATELITQNGDKVPARMYRMLGYVNDTLGDQAAAKQAFTTLFTKAAPEEILPQDYEGYAKIVGKIPGSQSEAYGNFQKAIDLDTVMANKVKYINSAAKLAKDLKDTAQEANWLGVAYKIDPDPSQKALFDWGFANYRARNYAAADSIFCNIYQNKFPDQVFGYMWCARTAVARDTTLQQGIHIPPYQKLLSYTDTLPDSTKVKYKSLMVEANTYLAQYYANVAKQTDSAIVHLEKIVAIDPTRTEIAKTIEQLKNPPKPQRQPAQKQPATKPATTKKKPTGEGK